MKLIARAPIDTKHAGRDYRPGDAFELDGVQATALVESGAAEALAEPEAAIAPEPEVKAESAKKGKG